MKNCKLNQWLANYDCARLIMLELAGAPLSAGRSASMILFMEVEYDNDATRTTKM